jgi:predicted AAA+ superfamily ATPase
MIKRIFDISKKIEKGKVLMIYGPRQVGKTTLVKSFMDKTKLKYCSFICSQCKK